MNKPIPPDVQKWMDEFLLEDEVKPKKMGIRLFAITLSVLSIGIGVTVIIYIQKPSLLCNSKEQKTAWEKYDRQVEYALQTLRANSSNSEYYGSMERVTSERREALAVCQCPLDKRPSLTAEDIAAQQQRMRSIAQKILTETALSYDASSPCIGRADLVTAASPAGLCIGPIGRLLTSEGIDSILAGPIENRRAAKIMNAYGPDVFQNKYKDIFLSPEGPYFLWSLEILCMDPSNWSGAGLSVRGISSMEHMIDQFKLDGGMVLESIALAEGGEMGREVMMEMNKDTVQ